MYVVKFGNNYIGPFTHPDYAHLWLTHNLSKADAMKCTIVVLRDAVQATNLYASGKLKGE